MFDLNFTLCEVIREGVRKLRTICRPPQPLQPSWLNWGSLLPRSFLIYLPQNLHNVKVAASACEVRPASFNRQKSCRIPLENSGIYKMAAWKLLLYCSRALDRGICDTVSIAVCVTNFVWCDCVTCALYLQSGLEGYPL